MRINVIFLGGFMFAFFLFVLGVLNTVSHRGRYLSAFTAERAS